MRSKRILPIILAAVIAVCAIAGCGSSAPAAAPSNGTSTSAPAANEEKVGVLSILNVNENEYSAMQNRLGSALNMLDKRADEPEMTDDGTKMNSENMSFTFFDTLDSMVMALESGAVNYIQVPRSVADYLAAHNDRIDPVSKMGEPAGGLKLDRASELVLEQMRTGFAFMMLEDSKELRNDFDKAIAEMKADGTLDKLVKEYITDAAGGEQKKVEIAGNGSRTVKIAVTGSLPPMDYVAPDGTFAGFNTALLAEIGKRLDINFEIKQVDSVGRATALSSGEADVVFWTRVSLRSDDEITQEKYNEADDAKEKEIIDTLDPIGSSGKSGKIDMPEGTCVTDPYFSDSLVIIGLKK